jgi:hypothetical protein
LLAATLGVLFYFVGKASFDPHAADHKLRTLQSKVDTVNAALAAGSGNPLVLAATGPREVTLILPSHEALAVTERQAMEIGLTTADRFDPGTTVLVKTPAGQVLAEAKR